MSAKLLLTLAVCISTAAFGLTFDTNELLQIDFDGELSFDPSDLKNASRDFGLMSQTKPLAVLRPGSAQDVARLVKAAYKSSQGFTVSARGNGHSVNGQALTRDGVVVDMSELAITRVWVKEMFVDAWGGMLWIDVLKDTLQYGLAPKTWTDYLYLSVGGTLSNAGISGQAFNFGPQISNVLELDVVTGKGELVTCSETQNKELFHAVLGGLGQFGIITRARIPLEPAPQRVRWIQACYSNFTEFTEDQEYLISLHERPSNQKFDYVEGNLAVDERFNNTKTSFVNNTSLMASESLLYCLEVTKNYNPSDAHTVDQEVDSLLRKLRFIPSSISTRDVPYLNFLNRVHESELDLRSRGLWDVPHPWLNLLVPKSRIVDFGTGVFRDILDKNTVGLILVYPLNKNKWNQMSSVVTPDEDVFYLVALLKSAVPHGDETQTLEYLTKQNRLILTFCDDAGIRVKQYLPHYTTRREWMDHFGDKWDQFQRTKAKYDPRRILATGQRIFEPY